MPKKCRSESFGDYGSKVRVAERDPGGVLYLLWVDKTGKQRKRTLGHRDRKRARRQARAIAGQLKAARLAKHGMLLKDEVVTDSSGRLTLREGVDLALRPENADEGLYAEDTRHARESLRLLDRALEILGQDLVWPQLTPRKVDSLIRVLARQSDGGQGARTTEYMIDMLYTVATWLRDEQLIPDRAALPRRNWKARMKKEWEKLTRSSVEPSRPRHSVDEVARIFKALPKADPRLALLIQLAAELRSGQAVRGRRSDLDLGQVGGYGLGRFVVRGVGRKAGEVVDLHPELRAEVDEALSSGYLSELEAAYQQGKVEDYPLFPAGRLAKGKAQLKQAERKHLDPKSLRDMFLRLEETAGVQHVNGRAFYGLRRMATDVAADLESDDRVLNRLTGHRDSETRKRIYQDREREETGAKAAESRRKLRKHIAEAGEEAARGGAESYPRVIPPPSEKTKIPTAK